MGSSASLVSGQSQTRTDYVMIMCAQVTATTDGSGHLSAGFAGGQQPWGDAALRLLPPLGCSGRSPAGHTVST